MFQASVLAVLAEQSWSFSAAPVVIQLAKNLAADPEALDRLSMDRTSASIKLRHGLAPAVTSRVISLLQQNKFSLNIDESTSGNCSRILTVLVNVFDDSVGRIVMYHLTSVSLLRVDTATVRKALDDFFKTKEIKWENCLSILMDSCNVMRGPKNGLEKQIRNDLAPHLLDIDGDVCHHLHNATKKFCEPFEWWVEALFGDIHNEFHWSRKNRDILEELCFILGEKYCVPQHFVAHRWLSCLDAAQSTLQQFGPLTVYAYGLLGADDKRIYRALVQSICKDLSPAAKRRVNELHNSLKEKTITPEGRDRRRRLIEKLFFKRRWTRMLLGFFSAVLPVLKEYVCLFQSSSPLTHLLWKKQKEVFGSFLSMFMLPDSYKRLSASQITDKKIFDIADTDKHLPEHLMFTGRIAGGILRASHPSDKHAALFKSLAKEAFVNCARYMQLKLPLNNPVLRAMSGLDPAGNFGSPSTIEDLLALGAMTKTIASDKVDAFDKEVRNLGSAESVPDWTCCRPDEWWFRMAAKYPLLSKVAIACFTCFHGPAVESSFSIMGNVIDPHSSRMKIQTFDAIQTVKYALRASTFSAIENFKRADKLRTPVNEKLCNLMRGANSANKKEQEKLRAAKEEKRVALSIKKQAEVSRAFAKAAMAEAEKRARRAHRITLKIRLAAMAKRVMDKKSKRLVCFQMLHSELHTFHDTSFNL